MTPDRGCSYCGRPEDLCDCGVDQELVYRPWADHKPVYRPRAAFLVISVVIWAMIAALFVCFMRWGDL